VREWWGEGVMAW
jgi:hypothetical protein